MERTSITMEDKYKAEREAAVTRLETNSRRLRVTQISVGHAKSTAYAALFYPAVLLGSVMAAMIGGLLGLGVNTIWQWVITIVASVLACWFALGLLVGFAVRCFVEAFNTPSGRDKDDSGIVVRVRELTEDEERNDPNSYTL